MVIKLGEIAGHHFRGQADLVVARHCTVNGKAGLYFVRKWLADRSAFNYSPLLGWAYDRWFEIKDESEGDDG